MDRVRILSFSGLCCLKLGSKQLLQGERIDSSMCENVTPIICMGLELRRTSPVNNITLSNNIVFH